MLSTKQKKEIREAVLRGCALLDRRHKTWFKKIDLDYFDLSSGSYCICGQLDALSRGLSKGSPMASWWKAFARLLGRGDGDGLHYGFLVNAEMHGGWNYAEDVWRREIKSRRRAAGIV